MRLSALSSANDSHEGRVVGRVFSRSLAATALPEGVATLASVIVEGYVGSTEGFAFCLSEDGDLLSQWRAYGQDGTGISIGFDPDFFTKDFGPVAFGSRFAELLKVTYGEEALALEMSKIAGQVADEFGPLGDFIRLRKGASKQDALEALADRGATLLGIFETTQPNSVDSVNRLMKCLAPLHFRIYGAKPRTFHEEREWRIIRYQHRVSSSGIGYFANEDSIRPYLSSLIADPAKEAIRRVVLGPKHRSDINWMRAFLSSIGLEHVDVVRSSIDSYR